MGAIDADGVLGFLEANSATDITGLVIHDRGDRPSQIPPASAHDLKPALTPLTREATSFKVRRVALDTGAYDGRQRRRRIRDVESVGEGGESGRDTEFESDAGSTTTASASTFSVLRVYVDRRAYPHPVVRVTDAPAPAATVRVVQAPAAAQNDLHACSPRLHTRSSASQSSSSSSRVSGPHAPVSASAPSTREGERTPVAPSARALDTRADYALPPRPARLAPRTLLPPSHPPTEARAARSCSPRSPRAPPLLAALLDPPAPTRHAHTGPLSVSAYSFILGRGPGTM
ncbi:hypothetical protein K438DRAFT_2019303 [Mycena galopus ATCC 62051]|nr:hypothetical protein K438DRAFT_2019303 [Mycena galopus ATCC 62051]